MVERRREHPALLRSRALDVDRQRAPCATRLAAAARTPSKSGRGASASRFRRAPSTPVAESATVTRTVSPAEVRYVDPGLEACAARRAQPGPSFVADQQAEAREGLREARDEVHVPVLRPARDAPSALDRGVVHDPQLRVEDAAAADHVREVQDDVRRVARGERVALQTDALARGQLDADARGEAHRVVARRRLSPRRARSARGSPSRAARACRARASAGRASASAARPAGPRRPCPERWVWLKPMIEVSLR